MNRLNRPYARPFSEHGFSEKDIAAQFEGMEIEFNDKATLFPVQVEKDERPRRRTSRELRVDNRRETMGSVSNKLSTTKNPMKPLRRSAVVKPLRRP